MIRLLSLLIAGCTSSDQPADPPASEPAAAPKARGPAVVLLTLDTTRADRLGAYGYAPAKTPTLDGLAAQGVRFERAYATVPLTTPSHASMLTGLYPPRHGIRNNGDAILPDEITTLTEHLQGAGYRTAASVSAFVTTDIWNLDQGFDAYFDDMHAPSAPQNRWGQERPAGEVVDSLTAWLDEGREDERPFFLWAHFYDPHHPYDPPEGYREGFPHPYDGEIAYMDAQIARLKAKVEEVAPPEGVIWVIIADHGESLEREHGELTHGMFVFDPTMRVPFILRPAQPLAAPKVLPAPTVSGVDVTPTVLGMLGLPVPPDLDGVDLSAVIAADPPARPGVYMESLTAQQRFGYHPEVAIAEGAYKLMDTPSARLFDLAADPGETTNVLDQHPDVVARLRETGRKTWAAQSLAARDAPAPEVAEQLAALGYITNDFQHSNSVNRNIDAKDRTDIITTLEQIRSRLIVDRDPKAAEAEYRKLLAVEPDLGEAQLGLARALGFQGRHAEAEAIYRKAIEREPTSAILRVNLANVIAAQGRYEESVQEMFKVLEQVPGDDTAQIGALRMLTDLRRDQEGIDLARKWLQEKPGDEGLMAHLGVLLARNGQLEEAEQLLRASLEDGVPRQLVHRTLGVIETAKNQPVRAAMHYRKELEAFPDPETRLKLAELLMALSEWDEAAAEYEFYVSQTPDDAMARRGWAQAIFNTGDYERASEILAPALKAAPDDPDVLLLHANILGKIGDQAEAQRVAARANELNRKRVEAMRGEALPPPAQPGGGLPTPPPPPQRPDR